MSTANIGLYSDIQHTVVYSPLMIVTDINAKQEQIGECT